jgi:hypothetical protein
MTSVGGSSFIAAKGCFLAARTLSGTGKSGLNAVHKLLFAAVHFLMRPAMQPGFFWSRPNRRAR